MGFRVHGKMIMCLKAGGVLGIHFVSPVLQEI
jgi:hypothetical protein